VAGTAAGSFHLVVIITGGLRVSIEEFAEPLKNADEWVFKN
jgi:hypothetical protein